MKHSIYIVLIGIALAWSACSVRESEKNGPSQKVTMPLSICLPVEDTYAPSEGGARRVMGDPGTQERFVLPTHLYFFIVKKYGTEDWRVWEATERTVVAEDWQKEYYSGAWMGSGDSVYRYNQQIILALTNDGFEGRVYAIASAVELSFSDPSTITKGTTSEEALLGMKFSTSSPVEIKQNLQNIYSTPYNYKISETYYGSFNSEAQNVPIVNLMLYHVAAKVDITWNVADSARVKSAGVDPIRLTKLEACNLFNGNAYCFKPMENSSGASPLEPAAGTGDTIKIVDAGDEGLWWEGRSYFYTIPYTTTGKAGYFPLQMRMETNGSGAYYRPTIYLKMATDGVFVPWMRATFNIKKQLTAGTAVMEAG